MALGVPCLPSRPCRFDPGHPLHDLRGCDPFTYCLTHSLLSPLGRGTVRTPRRWLEVAGPAQLPAPAVEHPRVRDRSVLDDREDVAGRVGEPGDRRPAAGHDPALVEGHALVALKGHPA